MTERLKEMLNHKEGDEEKEEDSKLEKEEENETEGEEKSESESEIEYNPPQATTTTENLTTSRLPNPLSITAQNEPNTNEQVNLFANLLQIVQDDAEIQPFTTLDQDNIEVDMLPLPVGDVSGDDESDSEDEEDDSEVNE